MTSKNSSIKLFFKLTKQDILKRIWCPIIIFILYFFYFDLRILMTIDNMKKYPDNYNHDISYFFVNDVFGESIVSHIFIICAIAFVCALSGFAYLHSKSQIDTYHSMPVKRLNIFFSKIFSSTIIFAVPFILHVIIVIGMSISNNVFEMKLLTNAMNFTILSFIFFLLVLAVSVIAICLTGNIIISILATGVFFSYSVILNQLYMELLDTFFITYLSPYDTQNTWSFSPLGLLINIFNNKGTFIYLNKTSFSYSGLNSQIIFLLIYTVIALLIGAVTYKIRPSDAAGNAIAFPKTEPLIKTAIVIPLSLVGGILIMESSVGGIKWFILGTMVFFVISCLTMEILFRLDVRGAFKHKLQFIINAVIVAAIVVAFKIDIFGYDTYIPAVNQIESYSVSIGQIYGFSFVETNGSRYTYYDPTEYRMESVFISDNPSIPVLIQKAISEHLTFDYENYDKSEQKYYRPMYIGFNLKNGKRIFRTYYIDTADEQTLALIADIFNDHAFKQALVPAFNDKFVNNTDQLSCYGKNFIKSISLTPEMRTELIEIYHNEFNNLTFNDYLNSIPVGIMYFDSRTFDRYGYNYGDNPCYVYPQFTNTISWLKENEIDLYSEANTSNISEISIEVYPEKYSSMEDSAFYTYTKPEQIEEIYDNIILDKISYNAIFDRENKIEDNIHVIIKSKNQYYYCLFLKDQIPDFVKEDIYKK